MDVITFSWKNQSQEKQLCTIHATPQAAEWHSFSYDLPYSGVAEKNEDIVSILWLELKMMSTNVSRSQIIADFKKKSVIILSCFFQRIALVNVFYVAAWQMILQEENCELRSQKKKTIKHAMLTISV